MRYIKHFEFLSRLPKVGDFVIVYYYNVGHDDDLDGLKTFLDNNVGEIVEIGDNKYDKYDKYMDVSYKNVPENIRYFFYYDSDDENTEYMKIISKDNINKLSEDRKELETYLMSKKYNL
jgi:hypothetical protein